MAHGDRSPLGVDPDTMRTLGYHTVDMLVDRMTGPAGPVVRAAAPEVLHERLAMSPPETPTAFEEILGGRGARRAAVRRADQPSRLPRVHPGRSQDARGQRGVRADTAVAPP